VLQFNLEIEEEPMPIPEIEVIDEDDKPPACEARKSTKDLLQQFDNFSIEEKMEALIKMMQARDLMTHRLHAMLLYRHGQDHKMSTSQLGN
jgi:hypothetical protein